MYRIIGNAAYESSVKQNLHVLQEAGFELIAVNQDSIFLQKRMSYRYSLKDGMFHSVGSDEYGYDIYSCESPEELLGDCVSAFMGFVAYIKQHTLDACVCEGRHTGLPEAAIFPNTVEDVHNYNELQIKADLWMQRTNVRILNLYVTGLTPCTLAVVNACHKYRVALTCWHYDKASGEYKPQKML